MSALQCYYCSVPINNPAARFCPNCRQPLILRDRYRLVRVLGQGGFGIVYEVWDTRLNNRRCALKKLDSPSLADQRQIEAEAGILIQYASQFAFIPDIYDLWSEHSQTYLVMEFIDGQTLQHLVPPPWPAARVEAFLHTLLENLAQLHSAGIIHRDIKPENIVLTRQGRYVLLDFGISKQGTATMTAARALSLNYAPPEQFLGATTDGRSDMFSLAATAYHLLTGRPPERADQRLGRRVAAAPPSQFVRGVPPQLDRTLVAMLETDITMRPGHAKAALGLLAAPTVVAPPVSPPVSPPVRPPVHPPVSPPVSPPVTPPVTPPAAKPSSSGCAWWIVVLVFLLGGGYAYQQKITTENHQTATARARTNGFNGLTPSPFVDVQATIDADNAAATAFALDFTNATALSLDAEVARLRSLALGAYGPVNGQIVHDGSNTVAGVTPNLALLNCIISADFFNPQDAAQAPWSYGFLFRHLGINEQYRLYVGSDGTWSFLQVRNPDTGPEFILLNGGDVPVLNTSGGDVNRLWLAVDGPQALFYVNGSYIATLDTSANQQPGLIWIGANFTEFAEAAGQITYYENFAFDALP